MILTIFLIILGISLIFIVTSLSLNSPLLGIAGFTFMFLVGLGLLNTGLSYPTGEFTNETYTYGTNLSGYHFDSYNLSLNPAQASLDPPVLFHKTVTVQEVYTNWDDDDTHLIGWLLSVVGFFGFLLLIFSLDKTDFQLRGGITRAFK